MPTVLDAGTVQLSNADVLDWIKRKRAQHEREDAALKASSKQQQKQQKQQQQQQQQPKVFRPDNYLRSLRKHERELSAKKYPYVDNTGAYGDADARAKAMSTFVERCDQEIVYPLEEKYRGGGRKANELDAALAKEQESKGFTEGELLMIVNHAPQCVEMLQNMLEGWEERYTAEELEKVLKVVQEVFRCGPSVPQSAA